MKRPLRMYVGLLVSLAFCLGLIYLPFGTHMGLLGVLWFGGIGVSALLGVIASVAKKQDTKDVCEGAEEWITNTVVAVFAYILPLLYLAYVLLKALFEG